MCICRKDNVWKAAYGALLLLCSCATLPRARAPEEPWGLLPPDSDLFAYADVPSARSLIEPLAERLLPEVEKPAYLNDLLERTERLYASFRLSPAAAPSVAAVVRGRFSPALLSFRLSLNPAWHRIDDPLSARPYWRREARKVELAAPECGLVLLAAGQSMERLLARWREPGPSPLAREAPGVQELLQGASLFAFLPSLSFLSGDPEALPIRQIWLAARIEEDEYVLQGLFLLAEDINPQALQNMIRLLAVSWLRKAALEGIAARLKSMQIAVNGRIVRIAGLRLKAQELLQAVEAARGAGYAGGGA